MRERNDAFQPSEHGSNAATATVYQNVSEIHQRASAFGTSTSTFVLRGTGRRRAGHRREKGGAQEGEGRGTGRRRAEHGSQKPLVPALHCSPISLAKEWDSYFGC